MRLRAFTVAAALAIAFPAVAGQVHFYGRTTAGVTLEVDTLGTVAQLGPKLFRCATLESVKAQVLPKSFAPPPSQDNAEGSNPTTYERWDATFCGHSVPVLIAFWPAADGGTMFRVGYPFPASAGAP